MSEGSAPANADETRIARDPDRVSTLDSTATRVAADLASPPPGFDPAATRIGAKDLLAPPRPLGSHEPVERFKVGDRIGDRYEVLAIHRGAMGVVYGTFDHELQLPRALKGVQDRFAANSTLRKAFAAEAAVWVRLEKHPFIARAYGVTTVEDMPYVVAEYIRGREGRGPDLRSWIGDPSVGLPVAVEMALQIAQGMQHAVRRVPGLVHRDLKPANILVNDRAQAMVTDFGLAAGGALEGGTPAYMAPEQWRGEPTDVRTDIYAFGCVLYELFTRHRVFAASTEQEWRQAHLHEWPYPPRAHRVELPKDLETFILRCFAREQSERPGSWDEVVEVLARWFHCFTGQPAVLDFDAYSLDALELLNANHSLWQLGGHFKEQLAICNRALDSKGAADRVTAALLFSKGFALSELGRTEEAISVYDDVLGRFGDAPEVDVRGWAVRSLVLKGKALVSLGRREDAVRVYDVVAARFGDVPEVEIRECVADALVGKALALGRLGQREWAAAVCDLVVARFADASSAGTRDYVAEALVTKGAALLELGRYAEAISCYDHALARFDDVVKGRCRKLVAAALSEKAIALDKLGRREEEVQVYEEVVARFADGPEDDMRAEVARALVVIGVRLGEFGRREEALLACDEVVARFADAPEAWSREQVATALVNKAVTLGKLGRAEEAATVCDEVAARFSDDPQPGVRRMVDLIGLTRKALENQLVRPSPPRATRSAPPRQKVDHGHLPSAPPVPIDSSAPAFTASRLQALAEWASTPWRGVLSLLKRR